MSKFVAWYRGPRPHDAISYIREYPAGNICQEYYSAGRESVSSIDAATRYDTRAEAQAVVPVYDGSHDIEGRSGVIEVFERNGNLVAPPDPWTKPTLIFMGLVVAYFVWQLFFRH